MQDKVEGSSASMEQQRLGPPLAPLLRLKHKCAQRAQFPGHARPMAAKTPIQRDWEQREFVEMVSVNVKKITEFLNKFGTIF